MKQPIETKTGEDISPSTPSAGHAPSRVLHGDRPQRADRVYRLAVSAVFLILTLLAAGDLRKYL